MKAKNIIWKKNKSCLYGYVGKCKSYVIYMYSHGKPTRLVQLSTGSTIDFKNLKSAKEVAQLIAFGKPEIPRPDKKFCDDLAEQLCLSINIPNTKTVIRKCIADNLRIALNPLK